MSGNLKVTVKKDALLAKLEENRAQHAQIVAEARTGYVEKAKKALAEKMELLAKGRVVALHFTLRVPEDHTKEYDTAIGMLKMSTDDVLVLTQAEYRMYVEDKWDWDASFLLSNAIYSPTSAGLARTKGYCSDDEDTDTGTE